MSDITNTIESAALPLMWNRPRLRFLEGVPDGAAPDEGSGDGEQQDGDAEQTESQGDDGEQQQEAEFDAAAATAKIRKANQEAKNLRDRAKNAEQEAAANKEGAEKVPALEAEIMRLRIALKHGLPENLAKRLSGDTEEELLADAEELLSMFPGGKQPPTQQPRERLRGGGDPTGQQSDPTVDSRKFAESIFDK